MICFKNQNNVDKSKLENKIPDAMILVKNTDYSAKISGIENKIHSITVLATNTAVENKIPDVISLVKKTHYKTKICEIGKKNLLIIIIINILLPQSLISQLQIKIRW